jgi:multiple sugar transport system substrate-binding protein
VPDRRRDLRPLLAVLAIVMSACMSGPSPTPSNAAPTPPPTPDTGRIRIEASGSIRVYGMSYAKGDLIDRGRVDEFTEEYPEVRATFSESAFDPNDFLAALLSAEPPDVVRIPRDRLGSYVGRGIIEPLDDCLGRVRVPTTDFREAAASQVTIGGVVYGLPEFFWVTNWLVDNDIFARAGLKAGAWNASNWDAMRQTAQTLRRRTKAKVGIDPRVWSSGGVFPLWVAAAGGQMLSDDGKESLLDTPEVRQALSQVKALMDAEGGPAGIASALGKKGVNGNLFSADVVGAFPVQQAYLATLSGLAPKTRFTARPFMARDGRRISWEDGNALAILANSDNKDAACAFVSTMTAAEAWIRGAEAARDRAKVRKRIFTGIATGNNVADDRIFASLVDVRGRANYRRAISVYRSSFDDALGMPPSAAAEEFRQAWIDALETVLAGDADPASALRKADQEAQAAIDSTAP